MKQWCILRMGAGATLRLVRSLLDNGFEAWTPVATEQRSHRRHLPRETVETALMPSFAFVNAERIDDLVVVMHRDTMLYRVWDNEAGKHITRGCPSFTLFHSSAGYALLPDAALDPLRAATLRHKPEGKPMVFFEGDRVKMSEGGFAGLYGTVDHHFGRYVTVRFDDWPVPVKILAGVLQRCLDGESPIRLSERRVG